MADAIKFYGHHSGAYACFSNFSHHPVKLDGYTWKTSEHYFQANKFEKGSSDYHAVRKAKNAFKAKEIGNDRSRPIRRDWEKVKDDIMYKVVLAKAVQHPTIAATLLSTGDAYLIEDAPNDYYWGCGKRGTGKNQLGKTWMRVRKELSK